MLTITYVTLFLSAYLIVLNINEVRLIMRGESNTYIKVKSVLDNSTPEDAKRNKNLIYLFTLLKGSSLIIPLAYNGLIMHENILILCWTALSVIYTVLSMFKVYLFGLCLWEPYLCFEYYFSYNLKLCLAALIIRLKPF